MKTALLTVMMMALLSSVALAEGPPMRIADFDKGKLVTLWDGLVGEWYDNTNSRTVASIAAADALASPDGRCLKMVYDTTGFPHYSGVFMKLGAMATDGKWPTLDGKDTTGISLWVKGLCRFAVEIKSTNPAGGLHVAKTTIVGSNSWKRVAIPYGKMKGRINKAAIEEIVFVFSDLLSGRRGVVLVDQIALDR
ncbi:MAG: hypothetical protein KBI47_05770 [Armatimonadetes bacterium]|nr:hypothetical protein [Armatimonadota bacterium]